MLPLEDDPSRGQDREHSVHRHRRLAGFAVETVEALEYVVGAVGQVHHLAIERQFPFIVRPCLVYAYVGPVIAAKALAVANLGEVICSAGGAQESGNGKAAAPTRPGAQIYAGAQ